MQHGERAWTSSMEMQHGDMNMEHGNAAWTCCIGIQNEHVGMMVLQQGQAAWP
jgi:hypothetical protein